eukprot:scaffold10069_cov69-Cylindrotheca_fusiformis.AAC.8
MNTLEEGNENDEIGNDTTDKKWEGEELGEDWPANEMTSPPAAEASAPLSPSNSREEDRFPPPLPIQRQKTPTIKNVIRQQKQAQTMPPLPPTSSSYLQQWREPPPSGTLPATSAGIPFTPPPTANAAALQSLFEPPPPAAAAAAPPPPNNKAQPPLLMDLFQPPPTKSAEPTDAINPDEKTALLATTPRAGPTDNEMLVPLSDGSGNNNGKNNKRTNKKGEEKVKWTKKLCTTLKEMADATLQPTTFAGAFMFLLYHVVFCLANGSAMTRPHSPNKPILGIMAKLSTVGIMMSGPFYIIRLGSIIPAVYPSIDLFLAPFLARAAVTVDQSLSETYAGEEYPEEAFFCSFCVLTGIGMFLSGCFLQLGATFKLANLGTFLPYSVLCGFFSAVGVLLWALSFSVDTSGKTWQQVFFSGDKHLIMDSLLHHMPSLFMGILMNRLGPKNPFFVLLLIFVTLGLFYAVMLFTKTSLAQAQEAHWFWSKEELVVDKSNNEFEAVPLCNLFALLSTNTNWKAVQDGLGHMAALAFLYLLRSSIHASAMKKNIGNLVRRVPNPVPKLPSTQEDNPQDGPADSDQEDEEGLSTKMFASSPQREAQEHLADTRRMGSPGVMESVRQTVQQVQLSLLDEATSDAFSPRFSAAVEPEQKNYTEIRAKPATGTLEEIFVEYGYALYVVSLFGGFGCCPTVATSNTMYAIGAEGRAPQLGSVLLLLIFYFTEFNIVQYIPKAAFSSLLVLGAVDTLAVWFFGAFRKTQDITEWLVVPTIVGFSLVIGFLNAVFLGIGISTFVFVGAFFRVGIVKFHATGKEIRSRVERSIAHSVFLNENGDQIQVLVLQNYLFFGNAAKLSNYIATMFEEVDEDDVDFSVPPMPKVVVVDFSLITGLDTSTVDIFKDIKEKCVQNNCKLYLSGLAPRIRKSLALGGVQPEMNLLRKDRNVRLFSDMDTGLGKAEDYIIMMADSSLDQKLDAIRYYDGTRSTGFRFSLKQIDELHGEDFSKSLVQLEPFVENLHLTPGQVLFESDGGVVTEEERGLFFIESGMLKISRDSTLSLTFNRTRSFGPMGSSIGGGSGGGSSGTLGHQHARIGSLARKAAEMGQRGTDNLRLARIGPGWVIGTVEIASGTRPPGVVTAVTNCSLHHLPFSRLREIEETDPILVLQLYKMLSHLMARREGITTEHLSTLHTIMSSHAHSKPYGTRSTMGSISKGSQGLV